MWITDQRSKRQLVTFLVDNVKTFFSSNQMRPLRCRPHFTGQVTQPRRGDRHLLTQISINSSTSRCPTEASLFLHFHLWCQTGAQVIACAWLNGSLLWLSRARLSSEPRLQVPHTSALPHLCSKSAPLADDLQCPNHSCPRLPVVRCHRAYHVRITPSAFSDHKNLSSIFPFDQSSAIPPSHVLFTCLAQQTWAGVPLIPEGQCAGT